MKPKKLSERTGKRAEYLKAHPRDAAVEEAHVKKICTDIGEFRKLARNWATDGFRLLNKGIDIGIIVKGFVDELPGKQLTLDFWIQFKGMFIDQYGHPVTQEQLIWFYNLAERRANKHVEQTEVDEMLSYRRELLGQVGLVTYGERAGGEGGGDVNYYNKFFNVVNAKKLLSVVSGIESDPNFGPIKNWPMERKQRAWLQFEPFYKRMAQIAEELKPIEA